MKRKTQSPHSDSSFIIAYILVSMIAYGISSILGPMIITNANLSYLVSTEQAVHMAILVLAQSFFFKWQFRWSISKWLLASIVGIIAAEAWIDFLFIVVADYVAFTESTAWLSSILASGGSYMILGSLQAFILRQYGRNTWKWSIACTIIPITSLVVSLMTMSGISSQILANIVPFLILGIQVPVSGFILGMTMLNLVKSTRADVGKNISIDSESENYRLLRLQDLPHGRNFLKIQPQLLNQAEDNEKPAYE